MLWMVTVVRVGIVLFSLLFMAINFWLYVKRKMHEPIMFTWGVICIFGLVLGIADWPWGFVGEPGAPVVLVLSMVFLAVITALFVFSSIISIHIRKNQELAMQISLLNEENEQIRARLYELEMTDKQTDEKEA